MRPQIANIYEVEKGYHAKGLERIHQRAVELDISDDEYELRLRKAWNETQEWQRSLIAAGWTQNDTPTTFLRRLNNQ